MFCKLFGFDIFKARLDSIQSFKIFNILSFLSFIPSGAILFSTSYMIYKHHISDQELMAYIDILVLTVACIVLAVLNSRKGDDFFEEKD
jgi:membrane protein DedA with SNARE-associated domain